MKTKTLTRAEIIDALAHKLDMSRAVAIDFLETSLENMLAALEKTGELKISSFGSFHVREKSKRVGRNPKTGKEATITPRKVISFKSSHLRRENVGKHR